MLCWLLYISVKFRLYLHPLLDVSHFASLEATPQSASR
nr:MAG TPA: hypothetical protein [Bacteriophage sp.]